ncbi:MAG: alpha-amylase family glycosyl hydrolase [Saprospiraceae bacterium]|nr:alpha-amylase family glycosyl hydrolase [Saprospiraceae bacterium]
MPVFPRVDDDVTITYDATLGNGALVGVSPVYAHMGVITSQSTTPNDWRYVKTTWGVADPVGLMQQAGPNRWTKAFNIRSFFGIPPGEQVLKLAFVFRNANGSIVGRAADGSDIFYPVYPDNMGLQTALLAPTSSPVLTSAGSSLTVRAAASLPASLRLYDNGVQVASAMGTLLEASIIAGSGVHTVVFVAEAGSQRDTARFVYIAPLSQAPEDPPSGTEYGINYINAQTVRFQLYAPGKQVVHLIGDFNDWTPSDAYQMKRNVLGNIWWFELSGLIPGRPYRFQYLVDGTLRIADPLSTLVLDPWNDPFIPPLTYPNLLPYPTGKTNGIVSVLQTDQKPYPWQIPNFNRPKKTDLVIYELLLRDFLARHDYQTLFDTLDYLQRLGVNAIELMPINEFDGNISWGYNPAFHKALDKYYGPPEALKRLVDECHRRGMAVIVDVVFNHATGASPLARLYWDAANNRPAANNPWLNPVPRHDFNVFYDFNHESALTKIYVKNCLKYWLEEFNLDGFRFDLSKGFTQRNTLGNTAAWGQYDASRVAILREYADHIWSVKPGAYVILEHFADNDEEKVLAEYGMMLWGNMFGAYKDVALGFTSGINADLRWVSHQRRGWNAPHLIGYMESHDEERIAYECLTFGNTANAAHNVRTLPVALRRIEMLANLLYTVPGPKMLWQFGELGYDYSINYCPNGTISNNCRVDPKPIRWDYYQDPHRRRLFDVTAALLHLRTTQDVFETANVQLNLGSGQTRSIYLNSPTGNAVVVANVGISSTTAALTFQHTGTWFEYYTGNTLNVSNPNVQLTLGPGEYRLYLDYFVPLPAGLNPTSTAEPGVSVDLVVYPNPLQGNSLWVRSAAELGGHLWLSDAMGRQVASALKHVGQEVIALSVGSLPAGLYFLALRAETGETAVRKVIVR